MNQRYHSKVDFTEFFKRTSTLDQIQSDIVAGEIRTGYAIEIDELCTLFQVDHETADDIIFDLISSRFIEKTGKTSALLVSYHSSEAETLGAARLKLESKALRPAIKNLSAGVTQTCRKLLAKFLAASSLSERTYINDKLISTIYFGPKIRYNTTKLEDNLSYYSKYLHLYWSDPLNLVKYHRDLIVFLDLCDQDNLNDAYRVMRTHISEVNDAIVAGLANREDPYQALCA